MKLGLRRSSGRVYTASYGATRVGLAVTGDEGLAPDVYVELPDALGATLAYEAEVILRMPDNSPFASMNGARGKWGDLRHQLRLSCIIGFGWVNNSGEKIIPSDFEVVVLEDIWYCYPDMIRKQIQELADKVSRRNRQIRELREKIESLLEEA